MLIIWSAKGVPMNDHCAINGLIYPGYLSLFVGTVPILVLFEIGLPILAYYGHTEKRITMATQKRFRMQRLQ